MASSKIYTRNEIEAIIQALGHYFPYELGDATGPRSVDGKWTDLSKTFKWLNKDDFFTVLSEITGVQNLTVKDIKLASRILEGMKTTAPATEFKGAEKPTVESTVPEAGKRAEQEEVRAQREAGKVAAQEKGEQQTREFIKQQEARAEAKLKGAKIKVVPVEEIPVTTLTGQDKQKLFDLAQAIKTDPGTAQKVIEDNIRKSLENSSSEIKNAIPEKLITKTAVGLEEKVKPFAEFKTAEEIPTQIPSMNPVSPFVAVTILENAKLKGLITDDEARKLLVGMSQHLSIAIENERIFNSTLTSQILPQNVVNALYGPNQITQFEVAQDQSESNQDGVELDIKEIYDQGKEIKDVWEQIASNPRAQTEIIEGTSTFVKSYTPSTTLAISSKAGTLASGALVVGGGVIGFQKGVLISSWARQTTPLFMSSNAVAWFSAGGVSSTALAASMTSANVMFNVNLGKFTFSVINASKGPQTLYLAGASFGNKLFAGYLGELSGNVGAGIVTKVGGQMVVKAIPSVLLSKIGAAIGFLGTPVGAAVGAAVGWAVSKVVENINWKKVKEWSGAIIGGVAGLIALPFLGLGSAVGIGLGAAGVSAAFGAGLGGLTLGGIGSGILGFFGALGAATLGAIATPILVTLIGFPVVVALILFIINSGAYVVPPSTYLSSLGADNPYLLVTKTANPSKIDNNGSKKVEYTVSITALKSPLTNVKIVSTKCTISKKSGGSVSCPPEKIPPLPPGVTVSPSSPYTFNFTGDYSPGLIDAFIYDSITVSADSQDKKGISTTGSAGVCIGDCAVKCLKVADNGDTWPGNLKSNVESATIGLGSNNPKFVGMVCQGETEINLCYKPSAISAGFYAWHIHNKNGDDCDVYFNEKGVSSTNDALFMITHELTHHVQNKNGSSISEYEASGGFAEVKVNGFCSYKNTRGNSEESMAEANGLFAAIPSWGSCAQNYRNLYPLNYLFAQKFMK